MPLKSSAKKVYIKDESFDPIYKSVNFSFLFRSRVLSGLLMSLGFLILGTQVMVPLVFFKTQDTVIKPMEKTVLGAATGFKDFDFYEIEENKNFQGISDDIPDFFYITIPKLKIENAMVKTEFDGNSPDEFLGHYKGSALPGAGGNSFIYGHSVLPWFFNPRNYKTIFSTLGNLEIGDEITIKYKDEELTYKIAEELTVSPNEVKPLAPWRPEYLNESTITLMTCWPAGTKNKRLLVRGILEK
jgi:LPXTG-site transpeptidase (sortase) family protein